VTGGVTLCLQRQSDGQYSWTRQLPLITVNSIQEYERKPATVGAVLMSSVCNDMLEMTGDKVKKYENFTETGISAVGV